MWRIMLSSARIALAQPGVDPPPAPPGAPPAVPAAQDPTQPAGLVVIDQADARTAAAVELS